MVEHCSDIAKDGSSSLLSLIWQVMHSVKKTEEIAEEKKI